MKVLVVDDNTDDRVLLRHIVERNGHQAIEAGDGQQAWEQTRAHRPDLIISDVLMPVMDGFQFLKRVREDEPLASTPFIFYSATYTEAKDQALAEFIGADGYIVKPVDPLQLWQEVQRILAGLGEVKVRRPLDHEERTYLQEYTKVVAAKLDKKVAELQKALTEKEEVVQQLLEAKLDWERTFESIADIATIMDPDFRIIRVNRKGCETLGLEAEKLVGRPCYEVFRGAVTPCEGCLLMLGMKEFSLNSAEITHENLGKTFQVSVSPVLDDKGDVVRIIHFAKDVTEQKELARHLRQAQKLEAIGTLAGGIAHDFNNILTSILGYAEMAMDMVPPESPAADDLDQVVKAGRRATDLVRQLLTSCRKTEQKSEPIQPHLTIKEALKLLRSSIPSSIEIIEKINPECGKVLADATQLHQIVMNLCTNAYQSMRTAGGKLSVSLQQIYVDEDDMKAMGLDLRPGPYVVLEVCDTGCGMDKRVMAKIFDPYFTTKKIGEGTGLGLSVVHGIVKSYGGHISVYSESGKGSTFRVYLPVIISQEVPATSYDTGPLPGGKERILVVDDEAEIVALERMMLEKLGYQITTVTSSKQALDLVSERPEAFDLIITDMTMPDMNGVELSRQVRAVLPEIPIILCTGFSELINEEKAKALGIQEFIMKPVVRRNLAEGVRKALDRG